VSVRRLVAARHDLYVPDDLAVVRGGHDAVGTSARAGVRAAVGAGILEDDRLTRLAPSVSWKPEMNVQQGNLQAEGDAARW
jgi:hypothetical protein